MSEESTTPDTPTPPSRRRFLQAGVATAGAAAAAATTAALPANAASAAPRAAATGCPMTGHAHAAIPSLTFGRMFPDLPPFAENTASLRHALHDLGAPGGPLDAQDDLFGPTAARSS